MTWFQAFRNAHGFTYYPDHPSTNSLDKPLVAVTYFCLLVTIATLVATLGIRGKEKWSCVLRASYAVSIGSIILVCIVSHSWLCGQVQVSSTYVYRSDLHFHGNMSINVGLTSANVTLTGHYNSHTKNGYVHFVESFPWAEYGEASNCLKRFLYQGLPEPVLRAMEFLTFDHGLQRWGRAFKGAGDWTWALLWTAFALWVASNVLLFSVIVYGAYTFFLTGLSMVLACFSFHMNLNKEPFQMVYNDDVMELTYGWSYWLTLVAGLCTLILGIVLIVMDHFLHDVTAGFFHLENLGEDEPVDCANLLGKEGHRSSSMPDFSARSSISSTFHRNGSSIFLEPERQPSWYSSKLHRSSIFNSGQGLSSFVNKGFNGDSQAKMNPLYPGVDQHNEKCGNDNDINNEIYDRDSFEPTGIADRYGISSRIPSLATLKEHQENHVNERLSTADKGEGEKQHSEEEDEQDEQDQRAANAVFSIGSPDSKCSSRHPSDVNSLEDFNGCLNFGEDFLPSNNNSNDREEGCITQVEVEMESRDNHDRNICFEMQCETTHIGECENELIPDENKDVVVQKETVASPCRSGQDTSGLTSDVVVNVECS